MMNITQYITERLIPNDFNEVWVEVDKDDDVYKEVLDVIKPTNEYSATVILYVAKVQTSDHYIIDIYGGKNGPGKWDKYIEDIQKIIKGLPNCWLIDLHNDPLDDVWDLKLGYKSKKK